MKVVYLTPPGPADSMRSTSVNQPKGQVQKLHGGRKRFTAGSQPRPWQANAEGPNMHYVSSMYDKQTASL